MKLGKFLLISTLAIIVLLAVVVWFYPSSEDFKVENPFWNGLRTFNTQFEALPLSTLEDLPPAPKGTTLLLIPYAQFSDAELKALEEYVSLGGTLIILDDYGYGNEVLDYLGLEPRFSGKPLLDPLFNYKNKWFPRILDFASTDFSDVESIALNHASSLSGVSEAEVIASSSQFSFLDLNGNAAADEKEPTGPLPIAANIGVGEGCLILVADPSILINSMEDIDDNHCFLKKIIEIQSPTPRILLDQSHLPPEATLGQAKGVLETAYDKLSSPLVASGLVAVILALALRPVWRKK